METAGKTNMPRGMIAAASSGSGKTLLTCGLLDLLSRRGLSLAAFKCGPDYIDPMFHREVLGVESDNLDPFFCGADELKDILLRKCGSHALIEGVMGIYDGMSVEDRRASCYETAVMTGTPILLVVNAAGVGRTILSQIKGILADDDGSRIRGIILNRISERFYEKLRPGLEQELAEEGYGAVKLLGGLPTIRDAEFDSRHLGLRMPDEIRGIRERIRRLGEEIEKHCDIEALLKIMESAEEITPSCGALQRKSGEAFGGKRPLIAVARDEAFCFCYGENLRLLEEYGAELTFFSPIRDEKLPDKTAGLLLGGGYPELHLESLSGNRSMLESIGNAIARGMPSIAECGGFMYLHRSVRDRDGKEYPLVAAVDGSCADAGHPVRFGYLQLAQGAGNRAFGSDLSGMKGHEFHYYESTTCNDSCLAEKPVTKEQWRCMICDERRMWGYPHFYYSSRPDWLEAFVRAAREYETTIVNGAQ